jgi:plastocyanin
MAKGTTMHIQALRMRLGFSVFLAVVAAFLVSMGAWAAIAQQHAVSQKGRQFKPVEITINRGETVQIVNDDGDLRHHAYVDSDKFSFDSGDQEPGTKANITFPLAGEFDVLCAIHPKMKLVVHVK